MDSFVHLSSAARAPDQQREPTVRLHDGERQLREGDAVPLPRGPHGGHQIRNETDAVARVLIMSSNARPDVAEYPQTGMIGVALDQASSTGVTTRRRTPVPRDFSPACASVRKCRLKRIKALHLAA